MGTCQLRAPAITDAQRAVPLELAIARAPQHGQPAVVHEVVFQLRNARGLSLHSYALPGYPASHACVRLLERDAIWIYEWGEGSTRMPGKKTVRRGTPLLIVGHYSFEAAPPWRSLLGIGAQQELEEETRQFGVSLCAKRGRIFLGHYRIATEVVYESRHNQGLNHEVRDCHRRSIEFGERGRFRFMVKGPHESNRLADYFGSSDGLSAEPVSIHPGTAFRA